MPLAISAPATPSLNARICGCLRDPFSAKPHVLFYATKRVGGDVSDFAAIKLMKFGTVLKTFGRKTSPRALSGAWAGASDLVVSS